MGFNLGKAVLGGAGAGFLKGSGKIKPTRSAGILSAETDTEGARAGKQYGQYQDILGGGQDALNQSIESAMSAAMPEFRKAMQGTQETEIARGVGLGELGTSYEGDLESAFQRNIANAAGSQALGLYGERLGASQYGYESGENRYMESLSGNRDYETSLENANRKRKSGLFGALGGVAGGLIGGPMGAELGAAAGSAL